jgi:mevalonate kinase
MSVREAGCKSSGSGGGDASQLSSSAGCRSPSIRVVSRNKGDNTAAAGGG